MTDALDAKIARLAARVTSRNKDRAADVRAELSAIGFLAEAEALRERFGARLAYLRTPRVEHGDGALMRPGVVGWTQYIPPKVRK